MQPNTNSNQNDRGLKVPNRAGSDSGLPNERRATVNLIQQQIDQIYGSPQPNEQIAGQIPVVSVSKDQNPYQRTHSEAIDIEAQENNPETQAHWQKYHSAWQKYYQMYYERYYQSQVLNQALAAEPNNNPGQIVAKQPEVLTNDQAVGELRTELMKKVRAGTQKVRHSRHFMPTIVAVVVAFTFLFLQYNPFIFASIKSFTSPGASESTNYIVDISTNIKVGPEPKIIIPKINVEAPVVYDVTSIAESVIQSKLKNGVVHYPIPGANALPGQAGNSVILGHSSNDVFDDGAYKFIFVQLDRLEKGDTFYLNYNSVRHTYTVTAKEIINPNEVSKLTAGNGKPLVLLVTCTPVGTALQRLVVTGEQISPSPDKAVAQTEEQKLSTSEAISIGGSSPSFFERLFNFAN